MFENIIQTIRCQLPTACIVCAQAAANDYAICSDCETRLPRLGESCSRCGVELGARLSHDGYCGLCLRLPPSFATCKAAFPYTSPISTLIANFKFSGRFDIGYALARILAKAFDAYYCEKEKPELLLPVPLHPRRLRSRGFNQAHEICKVLSRNCQVATSNSVLQKSRNTAAQTTMISANARKQNLRGSFTLSRPNRLKDVTHIAIVDDVVTTMATVEALTKMLLAQQECRVDVWCLARANK